VRCVAIFQLCLSAFFIHRRQPRRPWNLRRGTRHSRVVRTQILPLPPLARPLAAFPNLKTQVLSVYFCMTSHSHSLLILKFIAHSVFIAHSDVHCSFRYSLLIQIFFAHSDDYATQMFGQDFTRLPAEQKERYKDSFTSDEHFLPPSSCYTTSASVITKILRNAHAASSLLTCSQQGCQ